MAESTIDSIPQQPKPVVESHEGSEDEHLKYLEFVQVLALHALMQTAKLYSYAKEKSGPLKPSVDSVEGTVKTVIGPVYEKFHDVPIGLLKFVDRKVGESVHTVQSHVPPSVKTVSAQVLEKVQEAPKSARSVMWDVKTTGMVETASGMAKTMYTKYEPVAEHYAISAWHSLNKLPFFPRVAQTVVVPTASYCSDKYNEAVINAAEKGYRVATHLPLVPVEKIANALST